MASASQLQTSNAAAARTIGAPSILLPTWHQSADAARPHIETSGATYSYVIVERGQELRRDTTTDPDELLYWIFRDVTFTMAADHEADNRIPDQDSRILLFAKQDEVLQAINPTWTSRCRRDRNHRDHQPPR